MSYLPGPSVVGSDGDGSAACFEAPRWSFRGCWSWLRLPLTEAGLADAHAVAAVCEARPGRHRYDKFGWTTRSSQLYESRLLRIASPMFHFGILVVVFGHVIGLLIPES